MQPLTTTLRLLSGHGFDERRYVATPSAGDLLSATFAQYGVQVSVGDDADAACIMGILAKHRKHPEHVSLEEFEALVPMYLALNVLR
jgi:hypothetical protein